jgi:hypothetical protein
MQTTSPWKSVFFLGLLVISTSVLAVTPDEEEDKKCIKPKFRDFAPEAKAEVNPGSDITFHVSHNSEPSTIAAEAKGVKMKVNVKDRKTFYEVKTNLPTELRGTFARISVSARALEGECIGHDGWLIKIKGDETAVTATDSTDKTTKTQ